MVEVPMDDWENGEEINSDDSDDDDEVGSVNENMNELGESEDEEDSDDIDGEFGQIDDEIVEQFILNFHNGDYDTKFNDALCSDQDVASPDDTRPTQASYNKPDNWRERNRIGLTKVKEQLKKSIDSVSHDTSFNLDLTHNSPWMQLMDNEEPIVWHEPIFDEYWDQLEAKMNQLEIGTDIRCIGIENVEITKERLAALVAMFVSGKATNSSTYASFINANLCGEGIISLSRLVVNSSQLTKLMVNHNRIDNMESARCLSRSLKSHACIIDLHLNHCDLGSSPEILLVILQSDVSIIRLSNNNIDSLGAVKIAEHLESDPPIKELSLICNRLNDDDAILISQALKRNTNLRELCLFSNNFTSIGVKALLVCLFDSSSLNAISESNHTLTEMLIFLEQMTGVVSCSHNLEGCIDRFLLMDRTQKLLLALQDKDSLLQYLTIVPVRVIPDVLAFPHGRVVDEHQHKHLNIVYSIMRWWSMPLLYSYHYCVKSDAKRKRVN